MLDTTNSDDPGKNQADRPTLCPNGHELLWTSTLLYGSGPYRPDQQEHIALLALTAECIGDECVRFWQWAEGDLHQADPIVAAVLRHIRPLKEDAELHAEGARRYHAIVLLAKHLINAFQREVFGTTNAIRGDTMLSAFAVLRAAEPLRNLVEATSNLSEFDDV